MGYRFHIWLRCEYKIFFLSLASMRTGCLNVLAIFSTSITSSSLAYINLFQLNFEESSLIVHFTLRTFHHVFQSVSWNQRVPSFNDKFSCSRKQLWCPCWVQTHHSPALFRGLQYRTNMLTTLQPVLLSHS